MRKVRDICLFISNTSEIKEIECNWEGAAILKEGYNSASYTFWYRTEDSDEWMYSQFSIHFAKKKMFLMGVKFYENYNVQ